MEFREFMNVMFDLQEKFPGLRYNVNDGQVAVYLPVPVETSNLMRDAEAMFS